MFSLHPSLKQFEFIQLLISRQPFDGLYFFSCYGIPFVQLCSTFQHQWLLCRPNVALFLHALRPYCSKPHCELHTSLPYCYIDFQVIEHAGLVLTSRLIFVPCCAQALERGPVARKRSPVPDEIYCNNQFVSWIWQGQFYMYTHSFIEKRVKQAFLKHVTVDSSLLFNSIRTLLIRS